MDHYKDQIILLHEPKNRMFFPEKFSNEIYYSKLKESNCFLYKSNFSIKYVLNGKESYLLDGKKYSAITGQYLVVNDGRTVETTNECSSEAISIFLNKELIAEVYDTFVNSDEQLLDNSIQNSCLSIEFFENAFSHSDSLGLSLRYLHRLILANSGINTNLSKETYYLLAEMLVKSQKKVRVDIGNIYSIKKQTREELYRRVLIAKDYIQATAATEFSFDLLQQHSGLSKFHLIRVFKSTFSQTPYQYYLLCKINFAKEMLLNKNENISTVAHICGFADVFSFSKIFKKTTHFSPSEFRSMAYKN